MKDTHVILVDEQDNALGTMEKIQAHRNGLLHRAFSIFIIDTEKNMLLQQRAEDKYHSGGLWTNACCSHPNPDETIEQAAHRRLKEELGFECPLEELFSFTYQSPLGNGLTEHEYDHVLLGIYNGPVSPDPAEVKDYRYFSMNEIETLLQQSPEQFTSWFPLALKGVKPHLQHNKHS
ncbi:isopentenyl-diphosphate Delta-isomerase [Chitinophagaceae bacterium MMS25-I14]